MNAFYMVAITEFLGVIAPFVVIVLLIISFPTVLYFWDVYSTEKDNKKFQELLDKNRKSKKYNKGK